MLEVDTERKSKDKILTFQSGKVVFEISANKYIDIQSEIKRLSQKIEKLRKSLDVSKNRLENDKFVKNAKKDLIEEEKANIEKLQPEYEKKSKLFHSQKEVEGLYQNISDFASTNSLNIINLNKENPVPITSGKKKKNVAYFNKYGFYDFS